VVGDLTPIDVPFAVQWPVVAAGIGIGALVAATFALLPLLAVRGISPLQALRHDVDEPAPRFDPGAGATGAHRASVVAVAIWQARLWQVGVGYAAALSSAGLVLWVCARLLISATRRLARWRAARGPAGAGSPSRCGRASRTCTGRATRRQPSRWRSGSACSSSRRCGSCRRTCWPGCASTQRGRSRTWCSSTSSRPGHGRASAARARDAPPIDLVPIVPARLARSTASRSKSCSRSEPRRVERWAVRREYRHTYRDTLTVPKRSSKGVVRRRARRGPASYAYRSRKDVARNLDVAIGDRITWDVTGVEIESVVTSIRTWTGHGSRPTSSSSSSPARSTTRRRAPCRWSGADDTRAPQLQRAVVRRYPNVSVVDLAACSGAAADRRSRHLRRPVHGRVQCGAGALVLFGAIAASRFQRVRESALLRALGATRAQVRNIMLVEYAALGALAAFTGVLLAAVAGWLLMRVPLSVRMPFALGSGSAWRSRASACWQPRARDPLGGTARDAES
jgi:putative ABC transport system permease protein